MMKRYAQIQQLVSRLTDDDALRTFFTLYLAADSDDARIALEKRFWVEVGAMSSPEQMLFKAEYTRSFLKLPVLAEQILERVHPVGV
jgi:hypothetical protein